MINIGYVTRRFLPATGGIENYLYKTAKEIQKKSKVKIITQICSNINDYSGIDDIFAPCYDDYKFDNLPVKCLCPNLLKRIYLLPSAFKLIPIVRKYFYFFLKDVSINNFKNVYKNDIASHFKDCDIIHSFAFDGLGFAAEKAAKKLGVPFVITPFVHKGCWGDNKKNIELYNKSSSVIALSEYDRDVLVSLGVKRELVKICGVGIDSFEAEKDDFIKKYDIKEPFILFVGRLLKHKGFDNLAEAVSDINKEDYKITLVIAGPHTKYSHNYFNKTKLNGVKVLGKISEEDKRSAYFGCSIFCLPSISEIMPVSILEAWYAKKPVLVGDILPLRSFIEENKDGYFVKQNKEDIKNAIYDFLKNQKKWQEYGINGNKKVKEKYMTQKIVENLFNIYQRLCKNGKK